MIKQILAAILVCLLPARIAAVNDGSRYAAHSALASGHCVQIKVQDNGIYKLTYDDIKKYGFADPARVKVCGYGGWTLSEDFSQPYIDDLPEVPVWINKGQDGVFSSGDYLLFYGRGPVKWTYDAKKSAYEHENNPYSTYGSYFLIESETGPKEIETVASTGSPTTTLTVFDDYAVHEKDLVSISYTGRELWGENFSGSSSTQQISFPRIDGITSEAGSVKLSFAAASKTNLPVSLSIGGQTLITFNIPYLSGDYRKANMTEQWGVWPEGEKGDFITATVSTQASQASLAYLNYITLNMRRRLQSYSTGYTLFRHRQSIKEAVRYRISAGSFQVWDVTDNNNVRRMELTENAAEWTSEFITAPDNTLHEYAIVDPGLTFPSPQLVGKVANQDLHALPQTDMIIICPTLYKPYAEQLAARHRGEGLTVEVIEESLVFNEFSSGTPDATAYRRLMKMFYDRATTEAEKPRYLLLFGDGVFDNRHLTTQVAGLSPKNFLLTFQMKESLNEVNSYGSDDYFGFLDDSEGVSLPSDQIDIGVGRLPVSSETQAAEAVKKIINYIDNKQHGSWKSKIIFTADNTDSYSPYSFCMHANQSDSLARFIEAKYPEYMMYKFFMDAYRPVSTNGNTTYPEAKKAFLNTLAEGCFILNYTGHGSTTAWSSEDMLNITDVRQMTCDYLPLWITATCDFGWFDGEKTSAGEEAFLNRNGGAIALFTTSRVVYSQNNFEIHSRLLKYLFQTDATGAYPRLGDVIRKSKGELRGDANKLNYVLIGDPALRLNYPQWRVNVETINGQPVDDADAFAFGALDHITVSGSVADEDGNTVEDFSGNLDALVFDSRQTTESTVVNNDGDRFSFSSYSNQVFTGHTPVSNGRFEFSFTVPLDISYTDNNGKMIFYATDGQSHDAFGNFDRYSLTGTSGDMQNDKRGPEITEMYLNTETFADGDAVNPTPYFHARVADSDGINFSGTGLGHDITIAIDNNPVWTYNLNRFCSMLDNETALIGYSIPTLPEGEHTLVFRVWDILNNFTEDSLCFTVKEGFRPAINVTAFANPATTDTRFVITSNLPETKFDITVRIYTLTGQLVKTITGNAAAGYGKDLSLEWDLTADNGIRLRPGIYVYRATISTADGAETGQAKKIIINKQ
jgi:hypothetical protein